MKSVHLDHAMVLIVAFKQSALNVVSDFILKTSSKLSLKPSLRPMLI